MDNSKIKNAYDKIKPGDAVHERILGNILDRVHSDRLGKEKVYTAAKPMHIFIPIAACLAVAFTVYITALRDIGGDFPSPYTATGDNHTPGGQPHSNPNPTENSGSRPTDLPQPPVIEINELSEMPAEPRLNITLNPDDFLPMSKSEVVAFYGFDFFPKAVPADMTEVGEGIFGIYRNKGTGEVYYSENIAWYFDENYRRQLHITIGREKLLYNDAPLLADEYKKSVINGVQLVIARAVSFSGEQRFVAEMICEGNGLRVYSHNLSQAEFVDVILSLLQSANVG